MMDPFQALANFALGRLKQSAIGAWCKFLFELLFSATLGFLTITGLTLMASDSWTVGIGSGMVTAAVCLLAVFGKERSKLTRGMVIVFPGELAKKEIETNLNTETKPENQQ